MWRTGTNVYKIVPGIIAKGNALSSKHVNLQPTKKIYSPLLLNNPYTATAASIFALSLLVKKLANSAKLQFMLD